MRHVHCLAILLASSAFCAASAGLPLAAAYIPSDCKPVSGDFPRGTHTANVWRYKQYAIVLPAYKRKLAQSFDCGGEQGTLYSFEYRTEAQKDKALLFLRPVLKKDAPGTEYPIEESSDSFVLFSFVHPPSQLMGAVHAQMMNVAAPAGTPVEPPPLPKPAEKTIPPPASKVVEKSIPPPVSSADRKLAPTPMVPGAATAVEAPLKPMAPLSADEGAMRLPRPPPVALPAPMSVEKPVPPPVMKRPVVATSSPLARPVSVAPRTSAPVGNVADVNGSLLEGYASKMGCETPDLSAQIKVVCDLLRDFSSALPITDLAAQPQIGPVYGVDSYGRFSPMHYAVLSGTKESGTLSYFPLISSGGSEDFQIRALVDARKAKMELPGNDVAERVIAAIAQKRFGVTKTNGRSWVFQATPDRRIFLRKSGDRIVAIGASGATLDDQLRTSIEIIVFY